MDTVQKSLRIPADRAAAIERLAKDLGLDFSGAVNELLEQALRMHRCPGIVFTSGPAGRRATISGTGIDVWEVIATMKSLGDDAARLRKAYDHLSEAQLKAAMAYYRCYPEEIDARLQRESDWSNDSLAREHPPLVAETAPRYQRKRK
jgi:uncharacterized protein (DUF433 family)